ncbi:MAG: thioredoxin [Nanoarchaeota archaeon]|nr:thioredoxin [Nanoarchaeota archaeon]MBU4300462.1 thioredoxin [Nanoarchaeota archaeon]MBU4451942.1 thioredoxin [Nanoarchaeota archaeon]MCG2724101.1 thioredoxin [archaeon]
MELKFFESPTCPDCPAAKKNVKEVLTKFNILDTLKFFDISTDDGRIESLNCMVMGSPTLVIDEDIITKDILLDARKLEEEIRGRIN